MYLSQEHLGQFRAVMERLLKVSFKRPARKGGRDHNRHDAHRDDAVTDVHRGLHCGPCQPPARRHQRVTAHDYLRLQDTL